MVIEFVSWDGEYPNLCSGTLKLIIDGKNVEVSGSFILTSGGSVSFDNEWNEHVSRGPWLIDFTDDRWLVIPEAYRNELVSCVRSNIQNGCCGGCV